MSKPAIVCLLGLLFALTFTGAPARAVNETPGVILYLRRATFDPLRSPLSLPAGKQGPAASRLMIVQFETAPDVGTRPALEAAGLRPLLYIPDNAFLVRVGVGARISPATLPGLRWFGPLEAAYKLSPELEQLPSGIAALDLRLRATPDADAQALERDIAALGGAVLSSSADLHGPVLRIRLPIAMLHRALLRDDVIWVERFSMPRLLNDQARVIIGVPAAQEQLGLDGTGQIVAVTDTGLDIQTHIENDVNLDFRAARLVRGFTNREMSPDCSRTTWSDANGHGTHVAGTVLGSGARRQGQFAGVAPRARLIVQSVSSGGVSLDCLPDDESYLTKAYDAGARVQNASWGSVTDGAYTDWDSSVDSFLWTHKDHLFVVAAGNLGADGDSNGIVDPNTITSPGNAKNVLTVGATESNRVDREIECAFSVPEGRCWQSYPLFDGKPPFEHDYVSDNPDGMAAFSSRGPTDDGRIKPEIVAPGVNIISTASNDPSAFYGDVYSVDYAYDSGTSMAAPVVSGAAALVRQWLLQERRFGTPSAALVKALLLNGARDIGPGQYPLIYREIPQAWPNSVEGWGRAAITDTLGLGGADRVWLADDGTILQPGAVVSYTLAVSDGLPLRLTLAWTDYPGAPIAGGKALVNDLDLEVVAPDGTTTYRGNANADFTDYPSCRDGAGADRCNTVESVELSTPPAGVYTVRVRGANILMGPQPFALAARARQILDTTAPAAPVLQAIANAGSPGLELAWNSINGATYYRVEESTSGDFATPKTVITTAGTGFTFVEEVGDHYFRVRACNARGCGLPSAAQLAQVTSPPWRLALPLLVIGD